MITEKLYKVSNGEVYFNIVANDYKEALSILNKWRPDFNIKEFKTDGNCVLTKDNVEEEIKSYKGE